MDFSQYNIFNLRDLGGIKTKDGRTIKEGIFYRSGILNHLNDDAKKLLDSLNLKYIIDLRSDGEIEYKKDEYIPASTKYISASAITRKMYVNTSLDMTKEKDNKEDRLLDVYELLPFNNDAYKMVFDFIKKGEVPILFHCSAGKDRTGVLAALILLLLGVKEEDIIKNYMDSLPYLYKEYKTDNVPDTWLVKEEWISTSLNCVYLEYQSVEEYFLKEYGLSDEDIIDIRNRYLV